MNFLKGDGEQGNGGRGKGKQLIVISWMSLNRPVGENQERSTKAHENTRRDTERVLVRVIS